MRKLVLVGVLLLVGVLGWGLRRDPSQLPSVLVGRAAPDFTLPVLSPYRQEWGESFRLGDYLGRKPIVLNFWASWCFPACYDEAPVLESAWRRYGDRVLFVGVNVQDSDRGALEFIERFGLSFPQLFDPPGRVGVDYGMYGVPETFLIDRHGNVRQRVPGALTAQRLEALLEAILR